MNLINLLCKITVSIEIEHNLFPTPSMIMIYEARSIKPSVCSGRASITSQRRVFVGENDIFSIKCRWLWAQLVEDASFTNWAVGSPQEGANLADCAMLQADQVVHVMHCAMVPIMYIALIN